MAKNSRLPTSNAEMPNPAISVGKAADMERKYRAEDALRTIERAEAHKKDKSLMKDVKSMAREKIKNMQKIC